MKNDKTRKCPARVKPKTGRLKRWLRRIVILVAVLIGAFVLFRLVYPVWTNSRVPADAPRIAFSLDDTLLGYIGITDTPYQRVLSAAGGRLVTLRPDAAGDPVDPNAVRALLEDKRIDGLLLPGGGDVDPSLYGGDPNATMLVHRLRDDFEIALIHAAREKGLPILGICRGCQLINVAMGGRVRNLRLEPEIKKQHFILRGHAVDLVPDSKLAAIFGVTRLEKVVSLHGNCVAELAPGVRVAATGPGGTIEAIEADAAGNKGWIIGIQWHPEMTNDKQVQHKVFKSLVKRARRLHARRESGDSSRSELDGLPRAGEKLRSRRSLIARDKTRYDIEFYYHRGRGRIRAVVRVGDRVLNGLFNRFYSIAPDREFSLTIRWEHDSAVIYVNSVRMSLRESTIDTDAIYDAMEAMLGKRPNIVVHPPHGGVLKRTFKAQAFTRSGAQDYLVNERGDIDPFSLDSLCIAYRRERIRAQNPQQMKGIGISLIMAESNAGRFSAEIISGVDDISGYGIISRLDSDTEQEITEPRFHKHEVKKIAYWTFHTHSVWGGIVARYTFGFLDGWVVSAEKVVLGQGIGPDYRHDYLDKYATGARRTRLPDTSGQDPLRLIPAFRVVFLGFGLSLLLIAHLLRNRRQRAKRASSGGSH
jgi:putative glutamine amidotransferase